MADVDPELGRGGRAEPGLAEAGLDARVVEHRRAFPAGPVRARASMLAQTVTLNPDRSPAP